jgi:hypothetical protein
MARSHIDRANAKMLTGTVLTSGTNVLYSGGGGLAATNVNAAIAETYAAASGGGSDNYLTYSRSGQTTDTINFVIRQLDSSATLAATSTQRIIMQVFDENGQSPIRSPRDATAALPLTKIGSISVGTAIAGGPPATWAESFVFSLSGGVASLTLINASSSVGVFSSATCYAKFSPVTSSALGAQGDSVPVLVPFTWR